MTKLDTFTGTDAPNLELAEIAPKLVGYKLKNQATVIAAGERSNYFIVLCIHGTSKDAEYITWALSPRDGELFWGHYHGKNLREALDDYEQRVSGEYDLV